MPSKTAKQARFMRMCSNAPEKAKGKCPPRSVAEEFMHADKKKKDKKATAQKKALAAMGSY